MKQCNLRLSRWQLTKHSPPAKWLIFNLTGRSYRLKLLVERLDSHNGADHFDGLLNCFDPSNGGRFILNLDFFDDRLLGRLTVSTSGRLISAGCRRRGLLLKHLGRREL